MKKYYVLLLTVFISVTTLCAFDYNINTKSNILYYNTNYGLNGYQVTSREGGILWPKNSNDHYQFGAGIILGTKTTRNDGTGLAKKVVGHNSSVMRIDFVPGTNAYDNTLQVTENSQEKYPLYLSSDYKENGQGIENNSPVWPLWNVEGYKFGKYIADETKRSNLIYPQGPKFIGDETMVSIYKDTDVRNHNHTTNQDIPYLNLEVQEKTIFWDEAPLNDVVLVIYTITNMSDQAWVDASFGKLFDFDITNTPQYMKDRVNQFSDKNKNMYYCWSDLDNGPKGYMAISMLISPQLDANGYPLENDNYDNYTQSINIATSLNFDISDDLDQGITYEDLTSNKQFKASEKDDQRLLIASDKFNLAPGQSVNFGIAQIFGNALSDGTIVKASGDESELEEVLNKWQALYDKIYIDELKVQTTSIPVNDKHEAICYPNPSNGIVNISESVRDNTIIEIFDFFGTRILRNEGKTSSLDLTNFENGTYIISIKEGNNTKYDKIILQK